MIEGRCACGSVRWTLRSSPEWLTRCTCSYCRRSGALWAHADIADVATDYAPDAVVRYARGDRTLAFVSCARCGCTTHWESLEPADHPRMAVNALMAEPDAIAGLRIRTFDGADSWSFLD
jgi:hypothetical protein